MERENQENYSEQESEFSAWLQQGLDRDQKLHKQEGYAEAMMERADDLRKAQKENYHE